jgi:Spy/CpxP family protein refolding chaperone
MLLFGQAYARGFEPGMHEDMIKKFERTISRLDLSKEQEAQIEKINKEHKKMFLSYSEQLAPKHIKIKRLNLDEPVDYSKIEAILKEMSPIHIQLKIAKMRHRNAIQEILTPAQRKKMKNLHKSNHKKGKKGKRDKKREKKGFFR